MITLGAKVYFGLTAFALVAAAILGLASGASPLGILSFGWSGPIGDQLGYTVLLGVAAASFFMGAVTTAFRDADADAVAQVAGTETLPAATPPADLSPWPVLAAFGVATLVVGLVVEPLLFGAGVLMLVIAAVEWSVNAWADRATGDPAANRAIRNRVMQPIEIPAVAIIGIGLFVFFASRVLLAVDKWGAIAVFSATATLILAVAALLATRPRIGRTAATGVALLGGLTLVVGGIIGLAAGEREFHDLSGGHAEEGEHDDQSGGGAAEDDVDAEDGVGAEFDEDEGIGTETGRETENQSVDDAGDTEE